MSQDKPPHALTRSRSARNVLYLMGAQIATFVASFFSSPYIVHNLGEEAYGALILIGVILGYLGVLDLGLSAAATKYIAEYFSEGQLEKVRRVLWASILTYLIIGAVGAMLLLVSAPYLVKHLLKVSPSLQEVSILSFRISAIGFAASLLSNAFRAILHARQRIDYLALVTFLTGVGQPILVILLLSMGQHLLSAAMATASLTVFLTILIGRLAYTIYPGWGPPIYDQQTLQRLLRFGSWMALSGLVVPLLLQVEKIFLSRLCSLAEVAYYTVGASSVMQIPNFVYGAFATTLFPIFSGSAQTNFKLIQWGIRLPFFSQLPILLFLIAFGQSFMIAWMGPVFAEKSTPSLWIMVAAAFVNGLAIIPFTYLPAKGRPDLIAKFLLIEALVYVPLSYTLIRQLGLLGAPLAYLMRISLDTILLVWAAQRHFHLSWRFLLEPTFHPITLLLIALSLGLMIIQYHWKPLATSWHELIGVAAAFIILSASMIWWGVFSKEERHWLLSSLPRHPQF